MNLGRLTKVNLRDHWQHEAHGFTRWLAKPENLEEFCDEVGIGLNVLQTEASVGKFYVDILAEEEGTGRKAIIENQLESTDHSHLGQIITYAAGLDAEYIFWVVKDVREEHRQAIDWLNEHTDEKVNLFLIKIELWKIGESEPAPKFSVVSSPNNWTKLVRPSPSANGKLSTAKALQLEFWQRLRAYATEKYPQVRLRTPQAQHWYDVSIGSSECHVALTANTKDKCIGCELYLPEAKDLYRRFEENRATIDQALASTGSLLWQDLEGKKAARVRAIKPFSFKEEEWETGFDWLMDGYLALKRAASIYL